MTPTQIPNPEVSQVIVGAKDPRAIGEKLVEIDGQLCRVNILPPGPEEHDERTWPHRNPTLATSYPSYIYNGPAFAEAEDDEPTTVPEKSITPSLGVI